MSALYLMWVVSGGNHTCDTHAKESRLNIKLGSIKGSEGWL